MTKLMLIDASHPEETRVVVVQEDVVQEFDYTTASKEQIKGNIYLAKVTRVEPSLQAAFVEYGGNRQGFLPFSEIHPDYYQIPVEDKEKLYREVESEVAAQTAEVEAEADAMAEREEADVDAEGDEDAEADGIETLDDAEESGENVRKRIKFFKRYKIQEVIRKGQIMLVQTTKEERGNKGAAMTTYLSLAGRYCVLMPNTRNAGGISRKISSSADRKRLKDIAESISKEKGLSAIIRTAGAGRSRAEIKRDFEYLFRLWNEIRETTLQSVAPALIYEESDIIKRSIRDLYQSDIEQVLVDGEEAYKNAKNFMKMLMPSHAARIKLYKGDVPMFYAYEVEEQLMAMHDPSAQLASGGYLVIHQTEALVSVDVNSGKSTKERSVEETAVRTNIEAAYELARQLRLRDLAGLLVIDFIDMYDYRNRRAVERALKDALKQDRAKIQVGRISPFGLLEMSRQRLRPSLAESNEHICPVCSGMGTVRSADSSGLQLLRTLEREAHSREYKLLVVKTQPEIAHFVLNNKRAEVLAISQKYDVPILVEADFSIHAPSYRIERIDAKTGNPTYVDENGMLVTKEGSVRTLRGKARREAGIKSHLRAVSPPDYAFQGTTTEDREEDERGGRKRRDRDRDRDRNRDRGERGDRDRGDRDREKNRDRDDAEPRGENGEEERRDMREEGRRDRNGRRRRRRGRDRDRDRDMDKRPRLQTEETLPEHTDYLDGEEFAPESLLMGDDADEANNVVNRAKSEDAKEGRSRRRGRNRRRDRDGKERRNPDAADTMAETSAVQTDAAPNTASNAEPAKAETVQVKPAEQVTVDVAKDSKPASKRRPPARSKRADKKADDAPEESTAPTEPEATKAAKVTKARKPAATKATAAAKNASATVVADAEPAPKAPVPAKAPVAQREGPKRKGWWSEKAETADETPVHKRADAGN